VEMRALPLPTPETFQIAAVLHALSDPIRLAVVRQLAEDGPQTCGLIRSPISAPSMSRHFRILREAGVIRADPIGTSRVLALRRDELDARFPGLLSAVLSATE
jgi:DNA-binding transcriptional ArsR family regulator